MCNASTWERESLDGEDEVLALPYRDDEQEGEEEETSSDSCK